MATVHNGQGNLVGETAEVMNIRLLTDKFRGAPYKLGGWSRKEGFDCLSLIMCAAEHVGVNPPTAFRSITKESYPQLWIEDQTKAEAIFSELLGQLGDEIPPERASAGDILELRAKASGEKVFGIHAGQTLVLTALEDKGVELVNLRLFEIEKAYRWAKK